MKIRDVSEAGHFRTDTVLIREGWGSVLGSQGLAVYSVLACLADNDSQVCWPSYRYIAEAAGIGRTSAILAMGKLVKYGLVEKSRRNYSSNLYTLTHWSEWRAPKGSKPYKRRGRAGRPGGTADRPGGTPDGRGGSAAGGRKLNPPSLSKLKGTTKRTSKYKWMTEEEFEQGWYDDEGES